MRIFLTALLCAIAALQVPVAAAMDTSDTPEPAAAKVDPGYLAGKKAITAKDWSGAITALNAAAQRDGKNADIQNLLGYALRKSGDLDLALKHYDKALALNPKHRGAREYLGGGASWSQRQRLGGEAQVLENAAHHEPVGQQRDELAGSSAPGTGQRVDGEDALQQLGPGQAVDGGVGRRARRAERRAGHDQVTHLRGGREDAVVGELMAAWPGDQGRQSLDEGERIEGDGFGAVPPASA